MSENINVINCNNNEAISNCEGGCKPVSVQDFQNSYVSSLLGDIAKLQSDLDNEKLNCNRFQQLYCKSLASLIQIQDALKKNDINVIIQIVTGVFTALGEIESKSTY